MPLDPTRIRAICFDVDGTLSDTDDQLVGRIAAFLGRLPLLSGGSAELLARRIVMDAWARFVTGQETVQLQRDGNVIPMQPH